MRRRRITVVTGSRADYGLLYWLMKAIESEPRFELGLMVTGAHLSRQFGHTVEQIEADGFTVQARIESLLASDTPSGIAKSVGMGVIGFADALARHRPDLLLVLGDRYEILAAVQAALIAKIPVAHLAGGDLTEGAYDEAIRHSITKMAHLHFVTNEDSRARVIQLGESPDRVFSVGHVGLDAVKRIQRLSRDELEARLGFQFRSKNLLVTFHPATLEAQSALDHMHELTAAIDAVGSDVGVIITYPNADTEGLALIGAIDTFVANRPHCKSFSSLGSLLYLNALMEVDVMVGNSSSGLYEAPSCATPSVNIGGRQRGRLQAASVINCLPRRAHISAAIETALTMDCAGVVNPYGDGESSARIVSILAGITDFDALIAKRFFQISHGD